MALGHIRHQTVGETMQTAGATSLHHREIAVAYRVKAFLSCILLCFAVVPFRLLTSFNSFPGTLVGLEPNTHRAGANEPKTAHLTLVYRHSIRCQTD